MEIFEKINRAFGGWYEGLFGGSDDVRPRDILRRILTAMEEHRKEGIDGKVYVPNQYILEIAVDELLRRVRDADPPKLWLPSKECFFQVEALPVLGSGKLDLQFVKDTAKRLTAPAQPLPPNRLP